MVLLDEILDFIQQLAVHLFVFSNQGKNLIDLQVEVLIVVQSTKMLLPKVLLLCNQQVKLIFLIPYICLHRSYLVLDIFALLDFSAQNSIILLQLPLILIRLLLQILIAYRQICDAVVNSLKLILSLLSILILFLELSHQFAVILLSLIQSFLQTGIAGLRSSNLFFSIFKASHLFIQYSRQLFAFILNLFAFFLQCFEIEGKTTVFIVAALIFVLQLFDLIAETLNFISASLYLSFYVRIASNELFYYKISLLELDTKIVNIGSEIDYRLFVDV